MKHNFYVYILFDWMGTPRYVGKGNGNRWLRHERYSDPVNWMKNEFVERTWNVLGDIPKVKVTESLTEAAAFEVEIALIAAIGRQDKSLGPLLNMTDGGEGAAGAGRPMSPERRIRNADHLARLNAVKDEDGKGRYARMGGQFTVDTWRDPEIRRLRSEGIRRAFKSEEAKERLRNRPQMAFMGEIGAKATAASWADPVKRFARIQAAAEAQRRPDTIVKHRVNTSNLIWITNGSEETRINKSETIFNGWWRGRKPMSEAHRESLIAAANKPEKLKQNRAAAIKGAMVRWGKQCPDLSH